MTCASRDPWLLPLLAVLEPGLRDSTEALVYNAPDRVEWMLREMECSAALVSPLACAQNQSELLIAPDVCAASVGATGETLLAFREGLHHIETMATVGCSESDVILARIVLREKYGMAPVVTVFPGSLHDALVAADAVLYTAHSAAGGGITQPAMDMVDEWFDMTQLPFIRTLLAVWEHRLTPAFAAAASAAAQTADTDAIAAVKRLMNERAADDALHIIPGHHRYALDADGENGLSEFFRLAFFHGLHRDIPTLRFWGDEA